MAIARKPSTKSGIDCFSRCASGGVAPVAAPDRAYARPTPTMTRPMSAFRVSFTAVASRPAASL